MFYFRADASANIGSGHIMRCLAIAEELTSRQKKVGFISAQMTPEMTKKLEDLGIPLWMISPQGPKSSSEKHFHSHWLNGNESEDARWTLQAMREPCEGLTIDHYGIGETAENILLEKIDNILVIDDLADRSHFCRGLLDYNVYGKEKDYSHLLPASTRQLLGPQYAPIRKDLQLLKNSVPHISSVKTVILSFGGSDVSGQTYTACQGLAQSQLAKCKVKVVVASSAKNYFELVTLTQKLGYELLSPTPQIGQILVQSDFALGAGGVSQIERSYLGIPSLITSVAKNQVLLSQSMADLGICHYVGPSQELDSEEWKNAINQFGTNSSWLTNCQEEGRKVIDGQGCRRIADFLISGANV